MSGDHSEEHGDEEMTEEVVMYKGHEIKIYTPVLHNCETCPDCSSGHFVINCPICHADAPPHACPVCQLEHEWHQCPECASCHDHSGEGGGHGHDHGGDPEEGHAVGHNCEEEHLEHHCDICEATHPGDQHDCPICHEESDCVLEHHMLPVNMTIDDVEIHFSYLPNDGRYVAHHTIPYRGYESIIDLAKVYVNAYLEYDGPTPGPFEID